MKKIVAAATLAAFAGPGSTLADDGSRRPVHVAPFVGAYVPTGGMRSEVESAPLAGVAVSMDLSPQLAVVGAFGWAPTKLKRVQDGELDLMQYDLGLQGRHVFSIAGGVALEPFAGAGVGLRSYQPRHVSHGAETSASWYAGGGASLRLGAASVSLAARYYLSTYDSPRPVLSTGSVARRDVALAAAVGLPF